MDLFAPTVRQSSGKKHVPNKHEMQFIYTLHDIQAGKITTQTQLPSDLKGKWHEYAYELLDLTQQHGMGVFWTGYETLCRLDPRLFDWRPLIDRQPPTPGTSMPVIETYGTLLSEIEAEPVEWLWPQRLALGKITTLDGDPGLGKSSITLDIAARVSSGQPMPDGSPGVRGGVVLITPEDGLSDTIQPRLARAGAALSKIVSVCPIELVDHVTGHAYQRPFLLPDDLDYLEKAMQRVDARLVIMDPIMAILGSKDTYKDSEVRSLLVPIQMLMERHRATCIMVRHLTKNGGDNMLYRGGGSIAFIGLARTGLAVVKDPFDETQCVFAHIKSNLGKYAPSLNYSISSDEEQGDERPYVVWGAESSLSSNNLLAPASPRKPASTRQDMLRILKEHYPEALSPMDLSEELSEVPISTIRGTLKRLTEDGQVEQSVRGYYTARTSS